MRTVLNAGTSIEVRQTFVRGGVPVPTAPGTPFVTLLDADGASVGNWIAQETVLNSGEWAVTVSVPQVDSSDVQTWTIVWTLREPNGAEWSREVLAVLHPSVSSQTGDLVVMSETNIDFTIPFVVSSGVTVNIWMNNDSVYSGPPNGLLTFHAHTVVRMSGGVLLPAMTPYLVTVVHPFGQSMFNLWSVTPRMLAATLALENWVNKSKIDAVVPGLAYTQVDLLSYLERGLNLFNSYPPQLMTFTGTNMQGPVYEMWLLCASYYCLAAQIGAEGALAFDFSGQAVTLNVDRTASLESMLGRVEGLMSTQIPLTKKLLAKYGINGGPGHNITPNSASLGFTGLSWAPTTFNLPTWQNRIHAFGVR